MENYTIGIDIGGTNFRIGTVTEDGRVLNFEKNSSRVFDEGDVVETIYENIISYMKRYGITDSVKAVAVGIPSIVSKDKKVIISTPNLRGFNNIRFSDILGEKLGLPVYLDRDVNFLLMNDINKLNVDKSKTVLGFYVGTGFGNAIYIRKPVCRQKRCGGRARTHTVYRYKRRLHLRKCRLLRNQMFG